jgi:integrase
MRQPKPRRKVVVRYHLPDGTRCQKTTPGAIRTKTKTDTWYAQLRDPDGRPRWHSLHTTDEAEAWVRLRRLLRERAERAAGIRDDYTDQAARPLTEHVADWGQSLAAKGTGAEQVKLLTGRVLRLAELAGWARAGDVGADSCLMGLARLREEEGRSAQTRNHYLSAAKQFCRWCCRRARPKRLKENPLEGLERVSVEADRRHDRRCPTDEEIGQLMRHLATGETTADGRKWTLPSDGTAPVRCGMTGPQRALGYRVAMATGFRAGELRSLLPESFDLDTGTVIVRAAYSKRKRRDTQHLPPWLVAEVREWLAAGGGVWEGFPRKHPGKILCDDLAAAGVPYSVEGPDGTPVFFDMHSLRVWYISWAANLPGISPKALMTMARHSTAELTMKVYAKCRIQDLKAAVEQLPRPGRQPPLQNDDGERQSR